MSSYFHPQNNRIHYGQTLTPPPGYRLDQAVGMTYSLDLEAFLSVPVFLSCADQSDELGNNPYSRLQSITKASEKITLFCNGDGIKYVSPKNTPFYAMIENCIFPVVMPEKHYFHPKLWVIRYKKEDAPDRLRVIVLSRNLTFDQSMDIAAVLEAPVTGEYHTEHQGLADLIAFTAKSVNRKKKRDQVLSLAHSVCNAGAFDCGEDFAAYHFIPFGIPEHKQEADRFFKPAYDLILVSPFLTGSIVEKLARSAKYPKLITRLSSVTPAIFSAFQEVWIPKEEVLSSELLEEGSENSNLRDLHAKIIYRTTDGGNYLYLGSLNATENAFYKNVEMMLELKYKASHRVYWRVCHDLLPEKNSMFRLLTNPCDITDTDTDENLVDFSDVARAVVSAKVSKQAEDYQLVIHSKQLKEPAEIAPMMRPADFRPLETQTVFSGLPLRELSCLYIVRRGSEKRMIKIPTSGIPEERDHLLFNQVLQNKTGFYSYLLFLLSGEASQAMFQQENFHRITGNGNNEATLQSLIPALYEQLLRSAASSDDTIQSVTELMEKAEHDMVEPSLQELIGLFKKSLPKRRRKQ